VDVFEFLLYHKGMKRDKNKKRLKKLKREFKEHSQDKTEGCCEMCEREDQPLSEHHLIPREVHTKKRFVKRFGKKR
jgi:hypothetical protein